ncbi:MAG: hypothetical protein ACTHKP_02025, partial [Nitrososphaeraceae archaeon]
CILRILVADEIIGTIVVDAVLIVECVFFLVVPVVIFLLFNFNRITFVLMIINKGINSNIEFLI